MPLTSQQLARQRARALRDLTDRCTIERATLDTNDIGETTESFTDFATNVPCRLVSVESQRARDRLRYEGIGQVAEWLIVLPHDQDVHSTDRIKVTSIAPVRSFEVVMAMAPHTDHIRTQVLADEMS